MDGLSSIWPNTRTTINGVPLGDAWPCNAMPQGQRGENIVPFHKLTPQPLNNHPNPPLPRNLRIPHLKAHNHRIIPNILQRWSLKPDLHARRLQRGFQIADLLTQRVVLVSIVDAIIRLQQIVDVDQVDDDAEIRHVAQEGDIRFGEPVECSVEAAVVDGGGEGVVRIEERGGFLCS